MMRSRVAEATRRTCWGLSLKRGFCSGTRSRTADTEIYTGEQEAGPAVHRGQPQGISTKDKAKEVRIAETERNANKAHEELKSLKPPCEPSQSQKLESAGVKRPLDPNIQQKRERGTLGSEEVSCGGLDEKKNKEDNREYYKHHKASSLASDKTVDSGRGGDVIGWLPEQLESAEETLLKAAERWRQNAMRGDPHAPHSRVLRALRGEDF